MLRKRGVQSVDTKDKIQFTAGNSEKLKKGSHSTFFKLTFLIFFVLYIIVPATIYLSPAVRRHAVFLNYVSLSRQKNLSLPKEVGLSCTRHFFLTSEGNIKLGIWHVHPKSSEYRCKGGDVPVAEEFNDPQPIFVYLHGNAGTRGGGHRVELYKVLSEKLDAHVVAFDYRGYGDSTNVSPTEAGLVKDTQAVYNWLLSERVKPSRIFIWGHSLGTGVGISFLDKLSSSRQQPAGLILEAPFTSILDAARYHPLSIFHRYMPFFETLIAEPIGGEETAFNSKNRIGRVTCPLLILHAEDDGFVPFDQGKELYNLAVMSRKHLKSHVTQFVPFDGKLDHGHKNIYQNPGLPTIIKHFIEQVGMKPSRT